MQRFHVVFQSLTLTIYFYPFITNFIFFPNFKKIPTYQSPLIFSLTLIKMGGDNSKPQGPWQIKVEERLTQVEADTKDNKAKINDLTKNLNDNAQRWKKHLDKFDCNSTPAQEANASAMQEYKSKTQDQVLQEGKGTLIDLKNLIQDKKNLQERILCNADIPNQYDQAKQRYRILCQKKAQYDKICNNYDLKCAKVKELCNQIQFLQNISHKAKKCLEIIKSCQENYKGQCGKRASMHSHLCKLQKQLDQLCNLKRSIDRRREINDRAIKSNQQLLKLVKEEQHMLESGKINQEIQNKKCDIERQISRDYAELKNYKNIQGKHVDEKRLLQLQCQVTDQREKIRCIDIIINQLSETIKNQFNLFKDKLRKQEHYDVKIEGNNIQQFSKSIQKQLIQKKAIKQKYDDEVLSLCSQLGLYTCQDLQTIQQRKIYLQELLIQLCEDVIKYQELDMKIPQSKKTVSKYAHYMKGLVEKHKKQNYKKICVAAP